jgi:hypothetical protein
MNMLAHPAGLRDEVARLSAMIGLARQIVAMGGAVDLEPVGEGIARLCQSVATLPLEQGKTLRGDLEALSERLTRLGAEMQARFIADQPKTDPANPPPSPP